MQTIRKRNNELKPGDVVDVSPGIETIMDITDRRIQPTVKKECVALVFANGTRITAFLDDYSTVIVPEGCS